MLIHSNWTLKISEETALPRAYCLAWITHSDFGQLSNPSARFVSDFVYKNTLLKKAGESLVRYEFQAFSRRDYE